MSEQVSPGLDEAFVQSFADRWHAAWNSHDPERVQELCVEDVEIVDPSLDGPRRGHAAVAELMETLTRACPDYRFSETEAPFVASERRRAIVPWRFEGTFTGELSPPGFAATGERVAFHGDDRWTFSGDRLARSEAIYDLNAVAVAIGAAPAPGSRGERVAVWLQRLQARARRARRG